MTSVSPDARRIWRGVRLPLAVILLVVLTGTLVVLARGEQTPGALEPGSYEPGGSRALATLLEREGVKIPIARTAAEANGVARDATVLITQPAYLPEHTFAEIRRTAKHVVLVQPSPGTLEEILPGVRSTGQLEVQTRAPDCQAADPVAAGSATMGGLRYAATQPRAQDCYGGSYLEVPGPQATVTVLGSPEPLTNKGLSDEGNAALAMRLLGKHERLVWYLPTPADPSLEAEKKPLSELIPAGWSYAALQAGIAVVLLALWRSRRLGPVVTEPIPVVVRAAEATEGRARLYRKAKAAAHAGETLREAARARLRPLLGLTRDAEPAALVESVAARTGRSPAEVGALLYGDPPADDAALVRLADGLDVVEREVERS
ncbi:DUF4350 domain-containing protein [Amycolatopsis regifaucium]|uniref:DUF4350 domain-containing protein n=1 Tax=Amycolatopsis regifaucium TaxID=546365 RepID=A0A154MFV6_9PSEU|nr:DUF4350 domain-containing protein [Amycolatopsis regifaucium]KZB82429.1 hypothetical protein AVL48_11025 [Amycolatopsis regifaucium]OKA10174.1 hypothetical protein ATP06_0204525 [Amycolatopsis regifaucium]SFJ44599.1 hypothetical protein SAMN04489731_12182 [Amycolatopsis regifaucium]